MSTHVTGIALLGLSFALWGVALASPFVEADLSVRAGMGLGFYGLSYVAFGLGCKQLGGSVWPMFKQWLLRWKSGGIDA